MPNRFLKESICTSEDINRLSPQAEILFYRLIVQADDFGCYYGDERIVKSTCYPLRSDEIKCDQVKSWLMELAAVGLIEIYIAKDERKYIHFVTWSKHQQTRAVNRKFPDPYGEESTMIADDSNCKHVIADDSNCTRIRIRNRNSIRNNNSDIESESDKPEKKKNKFIPPTLDEVREYCESRNSSVDPVKFFDYYSAGNWKDSKGDSVKNWKQKVITWERKEEKNAGSGNSGKSVSSEIHADNQRGTTAGRFAGFKYDI